MVSQLWSGLLRARSGKFKKSPQGLIDDFSIGKRFSDIGIKHNNIR